MKTIWSVLLISLLSGTCDAQLQDSKTENIIAPGETILSIHQDQKGDYWFGSNGNGLYHYDGESLTHYTREDGLMGNQIRDIQEDDEGNLYFDTPRGVSKFDGKTFEWLRPFDLEENEWKLERSDLWFRESSDRNAVYRYDGERMYELQLPEQDLEKAYGIHFGKPRYSPYGLYSTYTDKTGNIWFGTLSAGVFRFDGKSFDWIAEQELTTLEDGRVPAVRSIIEDKEGNFWLSNILNRYRVSSSDGNFEYEKIAGIDQSGAGPKMEFPYFMSAVNDDQTGDLWMVTYAQGVWRYDGQSLKQYKIMNGQDEVLLACIHKDRQGNLLLGTHGAGVWKFEKGEWKKNLVMR